MRKLPLTACPDCSGARDPRQVGDHRYLVCVRCGTHEPIAAKPAPPLAPPR